MIVLLVGLVFTIFGLIIVDLQSQYPNNIDNSTWTDLYDESYTRYINESATSLQTDLEEISDEDYWFTNVAQGVVAIPNAILSVFGIIIASMGNGISIFVDAGGIFGIPTPVMAFGVLALIVIVVFSLINWWHSRTPV